MNDNLQKRKKIKKLIKLLNDNRIKLKQFNYSETFKQDINCFYRNLKDNDYDSIEYEIPENIEIIINDNYYYYCYTNNITKNKKITMINKNLEKFIFINITNNLEYKIRKYYIKDNQIKLIEKNSTFKTAVEAEKYKSLILNPIINY